MSYLVLARKYRPASFDEIVGQEHVTRALKNAIRLDRVAHAFLFTGARGVGKTTAARVLAKALQCDQGPTPEPCLQCSSCKEIAAGTNVDVFEIDGASNRGINEIRELREGVAYSPQRDRFKLYIIDEVHMLTSEAFNALLKTLEEPPRHVKFVFATTEPQKIPVTILSRCQRYDFKRVPLGQVKDHLQSILEQENVAIPEEGVRMVARESEGSVRDSLSLMDRVISFAGDQADAKAVAECLGIADRKWLLDLTRAMLAADTASALGIVADVHHYGYDMRAFAGDLLGTVRDLIVVKVCGTDARAAELSDAEARALADAGRDPSLTTLQRIFQILLKAADDIAQSRHPRLVLEMAIIRASTALSLQAVPDVLQRLEALERRLGGPPPPPRGGGGGGGGGRPMPQSRPAPRYGSAAPATATAPQAQPRPTLRAVASPPRDIEPPPPQYESRYEEPLQDGRAITEADWGAFVDVVQDSDPLLASVLENVRVLDARTGELTLGVANKFYYTQLAGGSYRDRVSALAAKFAGGAIRIQVELAEVGGTIAEDRAERRAEEVESRRERLLNHPVTQAALTAMDGTIVDVKVEEVRDD